MDSPARFSERLRPLRSDLNYRIPGDDVHHRRLSPARSRSRSRSSSRPRQDTPLRAGSAARNPMHFDIPEHRAHPQQSVLEGEAEDEREDDAEGEEDKGEEEDGFLKRAAPQRRTTRQSARDARHGASTTETSEADEAEPAPVRRRSSRVKSSPSPLRDVIDGVSAVARRVSKGVNSALQSATSQLQHAREEAREQPEAGGDEHDSAMADDGHDHSEDAGSSHETFAQEGKDEREPDAIVTTSSSPFQIRVSPPTRQELASLQERSASMGEHDDAQLNGEHQQQQQQQHVAKAPSASHPSWVLPLMLGLILLLAFAGRHLIPSIMHTASLSLSTAPDFAISSLASEDRVAIADMISARLSDEAARSAQSNEELQSMLSEFKKRVSSLEKEMEASVASNTKSTASQMQSMSAKLTDAMQATISERIERLIASEREEEAKQLIALRDELKLWSSRELEALKASVAIVLDEKLVAAASSSSSSLSQAASAWKEALATLEATTQNQLETGLKDLESRVVQQLERARERNSAESATKAEVQQVEHALRELISSSVASASKESATSLRELEEQLQSRGVSESDKQSILQQAIKAMQREVEARLQTHSPSSVASPALDRDELITAVTERVRSELESSLKPLVSELIASAQREQPQSESSRKAVESLVARFAELSASFEKNEAKATSFKSEIQKQVQELLDSVTAAAAPSSSSEHPPAFQTLSQQVTTLAEQLRTLEALIESQQAAINASSPSSTSSSSAPSSSQSILDQLKSHARELHELLSSHVAADIEAALDHFAADRTGLVDYALLSSGGRVAASTPTFQVPVLDANPLLSLLTRAYSLSPSHGADEMLKSNMEVGACWPMSGSSGAALLTLKQPITLSALTLQHVAASITPDPSTMPRQVRLFGVDDAELARVKLALQSMQPGALAMLSASQATSTARASSPTSHVAPVTPLTLLGAFTYDHRGHQVQTWPLTASSARPFKHVLFQVDSNYGSLNYTCIYRVRIHGEPVNKTAHK